MYNGKTSDEFIDNKLGDKDVNEANVNSRQEGTLTKLSTFICGMVLFMASLAVVTTQLRVTLKIHRQNPKAMVSKNSVTNASLMML